MLKSFLIPALSLLLASSGLMAQVPSPEAQALFDPEITKVDLDKKIQEAGTKISSATALEAQLIWGLRNQEFDSLQALLPKFDSRIASYDSEKGLAVRTVEEFSALVHYVKAQLALKAGDQDAFKSHITEAFWLNPEQSGLFAAPIVEQRKALALETMRVDMGLKLIDSDGKETNLKDQLGSNKAILIDFWASWCGPCMQLMPKLAEKSEKLSPQGITVVAMNTESDKEVAAKIKKEKGMKLPWLVEPEGGPFSAELGIDSIPRMILINPEGKVLYNGHPEDPKLQEALLKLDPNLKA